jgi:CrcB protein
MRLDIRSGHCFYIEEKGMEVTVVSILSVGFGGALGAMARYGFGHMLMGILGTAFPYCTLCVNILGSFLMGVLITSFAMFSDMSENLKLFMTAGFLGAFTTFSAFSFDTVTLFERGAIWQAVFYVLASVTISIVGLLVGMFCVKGLTHVF